MTRRFRFGVQLGDEPIDALIARVQTAEAAGFDVVHTSDHIGGQWAPLTTLAAVGAATTRVRLCPLVINNDFWHPVLLAREVVALDHLTDGRVELGLGAGHSFTEYEAMGLAFDPPKVRKARLAESVEILHRLFDGESVTYSGEHYQLRDVQVARALQTHLPIVVGVNGPAALAHAAKHADTIGLTMLGRTLEDGQRHEVRWEADRLDLAAGRAPRLRSHARNALFSARIARAKRGLELGSQRWRPHSVLSRPAQRPARASSSTPTGRVQGQQPIES